MKKIIFLIAALFFAFGASAQDESIRPGGFDANGCSKKLFSVSDTKKVHFSQGNLQYNAAQDKWRFAPRQYSFSCNDNTSVAQSYDGWIDLFGWGTSGWNSGATDYQPWSTSQSDANYYPGGSYTNSLTGDYANADWGVYNKIANGGNGEGMWRTLTKDEWQYLMGGSTARSGKNGLATIQGIYKGLVILPDEWTLPNGLSFTSGHSNRYATNSYTLNEWQRMESAGAVFMPAAGLRDGTGVYYVGMGNYWSSTYNSVSVAWEMSFDGDGVSMGGNYRYYGQSVRLVRDSRESRGLAFDEEGASYKEFSVSATSTVRFSKGNLQYNAAQNVWRFAAKQYLYVGEGNANIAEDYDGWIDLFGWGTSGWNSGATAYQPWDTIGDFQPGGLVTNNLTGEYANADWGVYNRINNGGNKVAQWRTLTGDEWSYLIGDNTLRSGKYGLATIEGTTKSYKGLVLLPDDWTLPSGVTFTAGNHPDLSISAPFTTNIYTLVQWQKMEAAGAVFLPARGYRSGSLVVDDGSGNYWLSTHEDEDMGGDASGMCFYRYVEMCNSSRGEGYSVRLVKD